MAPHIPRDNSIHDFRRVLNGTHPPSSLNSSFESTPQYTRPPSSLDLGFENTPQYTRLPVIREESSQWSTGANHGSAEQESGAGRALGLVSPTPPPRSARAPLRRGRSSSRRVQIVTRRSAFADLPSLPAPGDIGADLVPRPLLVHKSAVFPSTSPGQEEARPYEFPHVCTTLSGTSFYGYRLLRPVVLAIDELIELYASQDGQ